MDADFFDGAADDEEEEEEDEEDELLLLPLESLLDARLISSSGD